MTLPTRATTKSAVPKAPAAGGGEFHALFEVVRSSGRIEERIHIGAGRPQGVLDVVACERVIIDRRANEIVERTFVLDQ